MNHAVLPALQLSGKPGSQAGYLGKRFLKAAIRGFGTVSLNGDCSR